MREILFRGKRVDNGEWFFGNLDLRQFGGSFYACIIHQLSMWKTTKFEVVPETVGQYTGLTDKNGKKIFEGDILDYCFSWRKVKLYGRVGFSQKHVGYFLYDKNFEMMPGIEDCATMKVVGNKFDTPELWEEKEK